METFRVHSKKKTNYSLLRRRWKVKSIVRKESEEKDFQLRNAENSAKQLKEKSKYFDIYIHTYILYRVTSSRVASLDSSI